MEADRVVSAIREWEVTEKEVGEGGWFRMLGIFLMRKSEESFERDLKSVREEIKNGDVENALGILTHVREELSKARKCGVGMVLGAVVGS